MSEQDPNDDADSPQAGDRHSESGGAQALNGAAEPQDGAVSDESDGSPSPSDPAVNVAALEAMLMSTHHPLTAGRLAELLDLSSTKPIRQAVKALNADYQASGRSFRIEQVAGGFQILTLPDFGDYLKKLHQKDGDAKLTKAALETLSIIAYKQPILRADVEAIRGVACGETIRSLMEKHLVKIAGRAEEPGRPILYGTTKRFLELFGLNSLKELPQPGNEPKQA
jgi:segregation and condensation protein B